MSAACSPPPFCTAPGATSDPRLAGCWRADSYACCSPTRSSFISGRLPINVNILNTDPASFNVSSGEGAGVATMMTGIGEVLARGGCECSSAVHCSHRATARPLIRDWLVGWCCADTTAVVGKWDVGVSIQ